MNHKLKIALVFLVTNALSATVMAHTGADVHVHLGFISGLVHPILGIDHLAAMLAVGLWTALTARRASVDLLWAPAGFAGALLVGATVGLSGLNQPTTEPMIAASLLMLGLLLISRLRLSGGAAASLVGGFAFFHGLSHGHELAGQASATSVLAGMLCTTLLLHACGLALGWTLRSAPVWAARIVGTSTALLGAGLLTQLA